MRFCVPQGRESVRRSGIEALWLLYENETNNSPFIECLNFSNLGCNTFSEACHAEPGSGMFEDALVY